MGLINTIKPFSTVLSNNIEKSQRHRIKAKCLERWESNSGHLVEKSERDPCARPTLRCTTGQWEKLKKAFIDGAEIH